MVVFYAFTQLNIIQCLNAKINYYHDEKAYLIIRVSPIISRAFLNGIRGSNVFDEVLFIDMPVINTKKIPHGKIKGVRTFSKMKVLYKFYEGYLKECFSNEKCDRLIIGGGWNDAFFIAYYFAQNNTDLKILFVEEGDVVYAKSRRELYLLRPDMIGKKRVTQLVRKLAERKYVNQSRKHLGKEIYVSSVELYGRKVPDKEAVPLGLPCIDLKNQEVYKVVRDIAENNVFEHEKKYSVDLANLSIQYNRRKIIFLATYVAENEQLGLIDRMIKKVPEKYIIVKVHNSVTTHKKNFALEYCNTHKALYVDRNDYYFESLYTKVDFNNKILISSGSTLMEYTKQNWGQEPFLIFTHKIYDDYLHYGDVHDRENAVVYCKSIYSDPTKVMVPKSKIEFENMVEEAFLRSLGY